MNKKYIESFLYENLLSEMPWKGHSFVVGDSEYPKSIKSYKDKEDFSKKIDDIKASELDPSLTPQMAVDLAKPDSKYQQFFDKYCPWSVYALHGDVQDDSVAIKSYLRPILFPKTLSTDDDDGPRINKIIDEKWILINYHMTYAKSTGSIFAYHTPWMMFHRLFQTITYSEGARPVYLVRNDAVVRPAPVDVFPNIVDVFTKMGELFVKFSPAPNFKSFMKIGKSLKSEHPAVKADQMESIYELMVICALYKNTILNGNFDKIMDVNVLTPKITNKFQEMFVYGAEHIWNIDQSKIPNDSFLFINT